MHFGHLGDIHNHPDLFRILRLTDRARHDDLTLVVVGERLGPVPERVRETDPGDVVHVETLGLFVLFDGFIHPIGDV